VLWQVWLVEFRKVVSCSGMDRLGRSGEECLVPLRKGAAWFGRCGQVRSVALRSVDVCRGEAGEVEHHILNLGAGVQSTALFLMCRDGRVPGVNWAVFADTQDEPLGVYSHLDWLEGLGDGPEIVRITEGQISADLTRGENIRGARFASIPAYTRADGERKVGMLRRQCTADYKVTPIERWIRYTLLGLPRYGRIPKGMMIHQYFGISADEARRAVSIRKRVEKHKQFRAHFPLLDLGATRRDCREFLEKTVPHEVPRSACVFCPYKNDNEWQHLKDTDTEGWDRAVAFDEKLRIPGLIVNRGLDQKMYVHRSGQPLALAVLKPKVLDASSGFLFECDGGCGL